MREFEPSYFTSLAPFRELFAKGLPILTWHKLGSRPRGAQIKGLYLPQRLFARQLAELHAAGFRSAPLNPDFLCEGNPNQRVVLTFDDGYEDALIHALAPLARFQFRAIQFLVADRVGQTNDWDLPTGEAPERLMDAAQVREWLAAGQAIGSHTLNHPYLTRLSLSAAREEIEASKKRLEDLFSVLVEHFCYPYGDWNPAVRDLVAGAGYLTACTTDFGVNTVAADRFSLKRITARYASRNWKALKRWLRSNPFGHLFILLGIARHPFAQ